MRAGFRFPRPRPLHRVRVPIQVLLDHGSLGDITFYASTDHGTVSYYEARAYGSGTTTPVVSTYNMGKPTPDATSTCTVHGWSWLSALTPGDYDIGVASVGSTGLPGSESSSQSNVFTVPLV